MSDQWRTGAVISLEEIFRSREFGRRPTRWDSSFVATVDVTHPPHLEEVFLSDLFGHPEAIATPPSQLTTVTPSVQRPTLFLLPGRADAGREFARYRGAIGAVSGVAAAALVVAGMTSGTGTPSGRPTISAEGRPPGHGHGSPPGNPAGPAGVPTQPSTTGPTGPAPVAAGGSAGGPPVAQLASATTPATAVVVVEVPPPAPAPAAPSPPPPGGGTPPGTSPGGSVLTPVFVTVGTTVSTVGSTVTAASNDLAHAVPAAAPVTGLLGNVGATVTSLGLSVATA